MLSRSNNATTIDLDARRSKSGKAILIKDPPGLASDVLPMYFKHNNLRSFVRQLNAYGFRRNEEDMASGVLEYFHELFRAGNRNLLKEISRRGQERSARDEHCLLAHH